METVSVILLALIRRGDSICSITGKNYQELAIIWKLRNKNNLRQIVVEKGKILGKEFIALVFAFASTGILKKFNSIPTMCV